MPQDAELVELKERVDCRTVLERAGWRLDERESTRRAAKYHRGGGEIIIVTHEGKGWFDPWQKARVAMLSRSPRGFGAAILVMPGKRSVHSPALFPSTCPFPKTEREVMPLIRDRCGSVVHRHDQDRRRGSI